jgi:hypothetical protein
MAKTFSVSVRLHRVTTETTHVSVPLSAELLQPNPDGSGTKTIDTEKLREAAINLGKIPSTVWSVEGEVLITLHPLQTSVRDARRKNEGQ